MQKTLRHLVLCAYKDGTTAQQQATIAAGFAGLKPLIAQVRHVEGGENVSPENLNQGYTHCFRLDFVDAAGRDVYLTHPDHLAFVEILKPHLAQILVLDYWTGE